MEPLRIARDGDAFNVLRACECGLSVCDEDAADVSPWRLSLILFDPLGMFTWQLEMNCSRFDWILDPRAFAD